MHPAGAKTAEIPPQTPIPNDRRRRIRHKVHIPAYCSVDSSDTGMVLDLSEILDISEDGMSIQASSPLKANTNLNLCLDLSETKAYIHTAGQVVWSNPSGRVGIRFPAMPEASLNQLKKWLFVNALTGCDYRVSHHLEPSGHPPQDAHEAPAEFQSEVTANPDYTSVLAGLTAVKREVEAIGPNLDAALQLIAERSLVFVRASGAAIALRKGNEIVCRARTGRTAPDLGARLQTESGISADCVRTGEVVLCNDAEGNPRVDLASCRRLGVRSILAAPLRHFRRTLGLFEVLSATPHAFDGGDVATMQLLSSMMVAAISRLSNLRADYRSSQM